MLKINMNQKPAYKSLDAFKKYFDLAERPYWNIYLGLNQSKGPLMIRQTMHNDMDKSWDLLQSTVKDLTQDTGGDLSVWFPQDKGESNGYWAFLSIPDPRQPGGTHDSVNAPNYADPINNPIVKRHIESTLEMESLRREVSDIKKKQDDEEGFMKMLGKKVLNDVPVQDLFMQLIGLIPKAKLKGAMNSPQENRRTSGEEAGQEFVISEDDLKRIKIAVARLSHHLPDVILLLENLANNLDADPSMAQALLDNIN